MPSRHPSLYSFFRRSGLLLSPFHFLLSLYLTLSSFLQWSLSTNLSLLPSHTYTISFDEFLPPVAHSSRLTSPIPVTYGSAYVCSLQFHYYTISASRTSSLSQPCSTRNSNNNNNPLFLIFLSHFPYSIAVYSSPLNLPYSFPASFSLSSPPHYEPTPLPLCLPSSPTPALLPNPISRCLYTSTSPLHQDSSPVQSLAMIQARFQFLVSPRTGMRNLTLYFHLLLRVLLFSQMPPPCSPVVGRCMAFDILVLCEVQFIQVKFI